MNLSYCNRPLPPTPPSDLDVSAVTAFSSTSSVALLRRDDAEMEVDYIGSFLITLQQSSTSSLDNSATSTSTTSTNRANGYVNEQLQRLTAAAASRRVVLNVSLAGIKMSSVSANNEVYMAHALKRISYASCRPEQQQFAFVAREPRHTSTQHESPENKNLADAGAHYCHVFRTDDTRQADELNMIVGNAFRQAYVNQKEQSKVLNSRHTTLNSSSSLLIGQSPPLPTNQQSTPLVQPHTMEDDADSPLNVTGRNSVETTHSPTTSSSSQNDDDLRNNSADLDLADASTAAAACYPTATSTPIPQKQQSIPLKPQQLHKLTKLSLRKRSIPNLSTHLDGPISIEEESTPKSRSSSAKSRRSRSHSTQRNGVSTSVSKPQQPPPEPPRFYNKRSTIAKPARTATQNKPSSQNALFLVPTKRPPKPGRPSSMLVHSTPHNYAEPAPPSDSGGSSMGGSIRSSRSTALFRRLFGSVKDKSMSMAALNDPFNARGSNTVTVGQKHRRPVSEIFSSALRLNSTPHKKDRAQHSHTTREMGRRQQSMSPRSSMRSTSHFSFAGSRSKSRQALRQHEQLAAEAVLRAASSYNVAQSTPYAVTLQRPTPYRINLPQASSSTLHNVTSTDSHKLVPLTSDDEASLSKVPWFCGELNRDTIVRTLLQCEEGAFVVRHSASQAHCLALSVRVPFEHNVNGVSHFLIMSVEGGFRLKGCAKLFPSIPSLVTHHTVMPEQLPCRLRFTNWHPQLWQYKRHGRPMRTPLSTVVSTTEIGGNFKDLNEPESGSTSVSQESCYGMVK